MTSIYEPIAIDGFEFCHPVRQEDFETINVMIDGTPRLASWRSPPMQLIEEDCGKRLAESDSPWLGSHALIFRPRAVVALEGVLRPFGELLPLACENSSTPLVMYNVTRVLDALDEKASRVQRFSSGGIMRIARHVFRREVVSDVDIFKISNLRVSPTYVSKRFVDLVSAAGIRGLSFEEVWSG